MQLEIEPEDGASPMPTEPRRALALFHAANIAPDPAAAKSLLRSVGRRPTGGRTARVCTADCNALAARLRKRGFALDDAGVRAFKMERGFSTAVRIGPEVASAYARFLEGNDAKVGSDVDPAALKPQAQAALRLLLLIAAHPPELAAMTTALGVALPPKGEPNKRLLHAFCRKLSELKIRLDAAGLEAIAQTQGWPTAPVAPPLAKLISNAIVGRGEPIHDYSRITREGCTLSGRTLAMLGLAKADLGSDVSLRVIRGSYETGAKGAHPHLGGGVADLSVRDLAGEAIERYVAALRRVGFAAWFRPRRERPHIHAVAIGDRDMAPAAKWQVGQFFRGRDGRSRMAADPHSGAKDSPSWTWHYRLAAVR